MPFIYFLLLDIYISHFLVFLFIQQCSQKLAQRQDADGDPKRQLRMVAGLRDFCHLFCFLRYDRDIRVCRCNWDDWFFRWRDWWRCRWCWRCRRCWRCRWCRWCRRRCLLIYDLVLFSHIPNDFFATGLYLCALQDAVIDLHLVLCFVFAVI